VDRREALKKIGVGGVAVATASVVVSQPAFAYDLPTITGGGNMSVIVVEPAADFSPVGSRFDIVVVRYPTARCPASGGGPATFISKRTVTVTSLFVQAGFVWWANFNIMAGNEGVVTPNRTGTTTYILPDQPVPGLLGRVRKRDETLTQGSVETVTGDGFLVLVSLTFVCTYSDGTTTQRDASFQIEYKA